MALFHLENPLRKRFAVNTGWLIAQNIFQYAVTAVIGILAARGSNITATFPTMI